jgi:hypothetical protein
MTHGFFKSSNCDRFRYNTSYSYQDMIRDMLRQGESPTGHPRRVVQEQLSGETPLSTQLGALMRSEAYEDWLHAWELLRDHTPQPTSPRLMPWRDYSISMSRTAPSPRCCMNWIWRSTTRDSKMHG